MANLIDETVETLRQLAEKARRLPPPLTNQVHAFHEAKSELANDITLAANRLATCVRPTTDEPVRKKVRASFHEGRVRDRKGNLVNVEFKK